MFCLFNVSFLLYFSKKHLNLIDSVTEEQVLLAAQRVLGSGTVLAAVGPASQGAGDGKLGSAIEGLEHLV